MMRKELNFVFSLNTLFFLYIYIAIDKNTDIERTKLKKKEYA